MDIVAHALWAGIGVAAVARRMPISRSTAILTVTLAALPDLLQLLPILAWLSASDAAFATLSAYTFALPGGEPAMAAWVALWSHHLHCTFHSALVASVVSAIAVSITRAAMLPLAGWWSHILIDVFTHSADYYAVPVLYPISTWAFDGIAWTDPRFMIVNYVALVATLAWLFATRARRGRRIR